MGTLLLRGEAIGAVKGVLFDKDGTLSNSESHLFNLAQLRIQEASKLLLKNGHSLTAIKDLENLLTKAYGLTEKGVNPNGTIAIASREHNLISTATILCLIGETWPQAIDLSSSIFQMVDVLDGGKNNYAKKRTILPGAINFLKELKGNAICSALISNDTKVGIENFLSQNNLISLFANIWSADHQPAKPSPTAVKLLCKLLELDPSECALIGDADSDLRMARQSGIGLVIGYTGGWIQKPKLNQHQYLIHNWDELTIQ